MLKKILKKDILRNKVITITLFAFILISSLLVACAAGIIIELMGASDNLFKRSNAAHYVQMHSGELDQNAIDTFVAKNDMIKDQQTLEMININGANIFLGDNETSEASSVMENAFVKQSGDFDYLLDTNNEILKMSDGDIAVPIYHKQQYNLEIGDTVRIASGDFEMNFTITAFARDTLMNSSMLNSKRFLISDNDWSTLKAGLGDSEYLVEFQLNDKSQIRALETLYQNSDLPKRGTAVTYTLYLLINGLSDGIVAAVIIFISILLLIIAALCLRFTMTATIEEDYREIGVMKAIGISSLDIRKLYLVKYVVLALSASICGYILSLFVGDIFTANIALYMGSSSTPVWSILVPVIGSALVFLFVILFCRLILRRFKRISAVEALRTGSSPDGKTAWKGMKLHKSKFPNVNIYLGVKEVFGRFKMYGVLCFVFIVCSFLIIVPINILNTLKAPEFISYMGAGECDMRIDLQQSSEKDQQRAVNYIENDPDIEKYSALFTSSFKVRNSDGDYENLKVEVGDFTIFPLTYDDGKAPTSENEIALSYMNANELNKHIGDTLTLLAGDKEQELTVCGIYQDVTNGGKTAKGILPYQADEVIWFTINMDLKEGIDLSAKMTEYSEAVYPAKVTDVNEYIYQTLKSIIDQLKITVNFAFILSLTIALFITAMFFKMLIVKDTPQIVIMRSLGFTAWNIRTQYISRAICVLLIGIVIGTAAAGTLGEALAGALLSGTSSIQFIVNPIVTYILCPLSLTLVVTITIIFSSLTINKSNTSVMDSE